MLPGGNGLISAGRDGTVFLWKVDTTIVDSAEQEGLDPFLDVLFAREDQESRSRFLRDVEDFFYYTQLRR